MADTNVNTSASENNNKRSITSVIITWFVIVFVAACVISSVVAYIMLSKRNKDQTLTLVRRNVEDVSTDISEMSDAALDDFLQSLILYFNTQLNIELSADYPDPDEISAALYDMYQTDYDISIIDRDGIIVSSNIADYVNFDMHDGEQSAEFLVLLDDDTDFYSQNLGPIAKDSNIIRKFCGKKLKDGSGFIQIGIDQPTYYELLSSAAVREAVNRRIGENGYILVCNHSLDVISSFHSTHTDKNISESGIELNADENYELKTSSMNVYDIPSIVVVNIVGDCYVIGVYPESEMETSLNNTMGTFIMLSIMIFSTLFLVLFILINSLIVKKISLVNNSLNQISQGNLNEKVEVRNTLEFDLLSTDINATVDKLKDYIAEAAARIDADLAIAKAIQSSVLPGVFPPFPERKEFELYASMTAAKEVGGDFYDFYMLGENTLGFIIADVSGKSVPGAMFMMTSKTVVKDLAESGLPPAETFTVANAELCRGNDAGMFLTAWLGYLDLKTGLIRVANAGHNPPVLIRDGKASFVRLKPGLMLAAMDGMLYKEQTLQLEKGDILFTYTDGVTEAMNNEQQLYGEKRLIELLSFGDNLPEATDQNGVAGAVCRLVAEDVAAFAAGAEQSDDITMLCIRYMG